MGYAYRRKASRRLLLQAGTALGLKALAGTPFDPGVADAAAVNLRRGYGWGNSRQPSTPTPALNFELVGYPADYGRPPSHQYLADLQLWHDRIYVGHGDWYDNTGPVRAIYLDLATGAFVHDDDFDFDDEAVESFVVLDDVLYAVGTDAIASEGWDFGNLHRKAWGGAWETLHTVPRALHLFGLGQLAGTLVASGATDDAVGAIWQSWDDGYTWQVVNTFDNPVPQLTNPLFVHSHVTTFGDRLFVSTPQSGCFVFDGTGWSSSDCVPTTRFGMDRDAALGNAAVMALYLPRGPYSFDFGPLLRSLVFFDGEQH